MARSIRDANKYGKLAKGHSERASAQLKRSASVYGPRVSNQLERSASDYGKRYADVRDNLRRRGVEMGRRAQEQAVKVTEELARQAIGSAKASPYKAAINKMILLCELFV